MGVVVGGASFVTFDPQTFHHHYHHLVLLEQWERG